MSSSRLSHFLASHRRPYSLALAADFLGLSLADLRPLHDAALARGEVREVEPGIYISARAHRASVTVNPSARPCSTWRFDTTLAEHILDVLASGSWRSSRKLGKRLHLSHQLVCQYLTALMSIGAVGVTSDGYTVLSRDLTRLGLDLERGIISALRKKAKLGSKHANWNHVPDHE